LRYSPAAGGFVFGAGLLLALAGKTWGGARLKSEDQLALMTCALVVLWVAGFLFSYGTEAFKTALFPLAFLLFCIPIPSVALNHIIEFLQYRSADMAFFVMKLSGTPVHREGVVLTLPDLVVEVAPQCSGIRSSISIFILSLLAGYLVLRSPSRRLVLVLAAIPIMVVKNGLRIWTLSWLAVHVDKRILTSELHREGGIPFFLLGMLLIYPILVLLMKSETKGAGSPPSAVPIFSSVTGEADL
jgi:exosortase